MPSNEEDDLPKRKRRCRNACRQCRQSKVKCGMEKTPCDRCQRMGYACEWDPQFRRTRNQDRFNELEQRLKSLQEAGTAIYPVPTPTTSGGIASTPAQTAVSAQDPDSVLDSAVRHDGDLADTIAVGSGNESYSIRDIQLDAGEAASLFVKFFDKYHVTIPFIDPLLDAARCHQQSEFLFWSIISVASREQQGQKDFLSRLSPYFAESLGVIVFSVTLSLRQVQALLLLSLWPPTNSRFWGDRSMTLANIAMSSAMYLGLHNPYYEQEYTNMAVDLSEEERAERVRTWIACLTVVQNLSMDFGLPVRLPFSNWKVQEVATSPQSPGVPIDLQHYLMIYQQAYNIFTNLPERGNMAASSSFDTALLAQLSKGDADLEVSMSASLINMSLLNKLRFTTVQLQLRAMYFHVLSPSLQRKQGVLKAYETAKSLVSTVVSEDGSSDILTYSPRTTFRMLLLAACVIFKVLFSSYGAEVDYNSGKILFNTALLCLRQQAVQYKDQKDLPLRCIDSMKGLWHMGEISPSLTAAQPELAIQTRLGASVLYHCLAVYYDRLAFFYRQKDQTGAPNPALQLSDSFDAFPLPDMDPQLAFADFSMEFAWDPNMPQPYLQGFL